VSLLKYTFTEDDTAHESTGRLCPVLESVRDAPVIIVGIDSSGCGIRSIIRTSQVAFHSTECAVVVKTSCSCPEVFVAEALNRVTPYDIHPNVSDSLAVIQSCFEQVARCSIFIELSLPEVFDAVTSATRISGCKRNTFAI